MNLAAGIVWDPREPLPPELRERIDLVAPEDAEDYRPSQGRPRRHDCGVKHSRRLPTSPGDVIIRESKRNILPPLSISIQAKVVQDTAQVTITQLFWNDSDYVIPKCSYILPLPAGCTVTEFTCRIGRARVVKAKVKPKEEARNAFDHAVRKNRSAGLLEQATPEVFTTNLGNIPTRTKLRAEISFVTLLKHGFENRCSTTTLTIPTCIASRYGSPPSELQRAIPTAIPQTLAIEVEVNCAEMVRKISSDSHRITIESRGGVLEVDNWNAFAAAGGENEVQTALVKLEDGSTFLNRDFVLDMVTEPPNGEELPQAWLEIHPSLQNHKALMLTVPPKFFLKNQPVHIDGEIVFVADRSNSMDDKIASLRSAMLFFLQSIPQRRKFNIWCFGTLYTCLWPNSRESVRQETLDTALQFVERQFHANMGGTELLPALKAVVGARDTSCTTDIIVLTDGQVWRLDETISYVQQIKMRTEGAVRVFALGIGDAVSHELVEGIAKAGGGYAEVIPSASQGGWEDRLVAMLAAAVVGHIHPLRIELDGKTEEAADHERVNEDMYQLQRPHVLKSPMDTSLLSPFVRNRVYMLFDPQGHQIPLEHIKIITNTVNGQEKVTNVPVKLTQSASASIHKLGARAILGDLERGNSWIQSDPNGPPRHSAEEMELIRSEGESLGCKLALVSKWTSFYAVDEPYEPDGHGQDAFMDVTDGLFQRPEEGLDLLRSRGRPGQPVGGPFQGVLQAGQNIDIYPDGEDDTPDPGYAALHYNFIGDDSDSDSDSEDGGGRSLPGGIQANLEAVGQAQPGQYRRQARGRHNKPNTRVAQHAQYREAGVVVHAAELIRCSPLSQGHSKVQFEDSEDSDSESEDEGGRSLPGGSQANLEGAGQAQPAQLDRVNPGSSRTEYRDQARGSQNEPHTGVAQHFSRLRATAMSSSPFLSSTIPQNPFIQSTSPSNTANSPHPNHLSAINAPSNNLSTASALIPNQTSAPKSEEEQHGERTVKRIIQFQQFDGSFDFGPSKTSLKNILGDEFLSVISAIANEIPESSAQAETTAILIAIMTLFELRLEFCQVLWSMIVSKGKTWINAHFSKSDLSDLTKIEIYDFARNRMQSYQLPRPAAISPAQLQPVPLPQLGSVRLPDPPPISMLSTVMTPPPPTNAPQAASKRVDGKVLQMLLDRGAEVYAQDEDYRYAVRGSFDFLWCFKGDTLAEKLEFHNRWFEMVERYSTRHPTRRLTSKFNTDRAMAFAGVAYFVEQNTELKYAAGLWKEVLPFNLLWSAIFTNSRRTVRSVPTWSWVSVDGIISDALVLPRHSRYNISAIQRGGKFRNRRRVIRPLIIEETLLEQKAVNGQVQNATLSLRGNLNIVPARYVNCNFDTHIHHPIDKLYCLPILLVGNPPGHPKITQVHGILLQKKPDVENRFERVGHFFTSEKYVIKRVSASDYEPKSVIYIV
ncbi:hypothetical protein GJ744_003708 [Endocarpon pusillum]|uniref:VWFA domain-containing protein n=1 Tax=Endocarpon pusillum TaxID=364733 RepID=A0A8H7A9L2_9EURO|nr:hypothetical protein GJ744_003708 [Endocarpon pusillum]